MTDPVSLTAGAIATVAFQKFIESSAGELGRKYAMDAIAVPISRDRTSGETSVIVFE